MRACQPTAEGFIDRDGARIGFEVFGRDHGPTLLLMPTWCVVHSRVWKMQVPYLARLWRVVTFDGPGNGRSDRPEAPERYSPEAHVADALAVLDAVGVERVIAFAESMGTNRSLQLAARHPDRVEGLVLSGPFTPFAPAGTEEISAAMFAGDQELFLDRFMAAAFTEPHSTKAIEDGKAWGRETTIPVMMTAFAADLPGDLESYRRLCADVACPVMVVQGTRDEVTPETHGRALTEAIGDNASLVIIDGGGHRPDVRDPAWFSRLTRTFVETIHPRPLPREQRWTRATARPRRALFLSSPIGLGHARRDIAIAAELRKLQPDLEIDWLAQDPVTRALTAAGERIHPASTHLASEVAHFEAETAGHDLHCFQAWRGLDETQAANFMVLHDLLEAEPYDLVIGDEAWETDYFLHENPELKRAAYAWLTDFVGWLPMSQGGPREAELTADYNAQMVEQIARFSRVRDRSLFVGNPEDIVPDPFGPGLPAIREWTEAHYDFPGYISGIPPVSADERAELRELLGFGHDELVCMVTAGGSAVGHSLLAKVIAAYPYAAKQLPELRMVVVAGPRIDPASLPVPSGAVDVHGYIPDLHRHLAACDVALVQGGLTTAMELAANRRPFLYFPLARHFEQQRHVPHRLERYRAGRRMDFATVGPEEIGEALVAETGRDVDYRPVETDGAGRAARMLAELL